MKLFLVRHAVFSNPDNIFVFTLPFHLTEEGRQQTEKIGDWFLENNYSGIPIYSSPIVRSVQTAEIIAAKTKSFVAVDTDLTETYCKELEGRLKSEEKLADLHAEFDFPTREPRESVWERVKKSYEKRVNAGKDCIFVSHGDPLTILYYHLQKKEMPKYLWDPENEANVIHRGGVVEITIEKDVAVSFKTIEKGSEAI